MIDILVVCTGNACRSPMGAVLLQHHLDARGIEARVQSAGTMPWSSGVTIDARAVMDEYGLVVDGHGQQALTPALVEATDLVLCMTRNHVAYTVRRFPEARDRTFMVGELVRLGREVGGRRAGEDMREWTARVSSARAADGVHGRSADEVDDPAGEPIAVYRRIATLLDRSATDIVELLTPHT